MKNRKLESVRRRFERWRDKKQGRASPIPRRLWKAAVGLTKDLTVGMVADELRLERKKFRDKILEFNGTRPDARRRANKRSTFVEVNSIPHQGRVWGDGVLARQAAIEVERRDGTLLRLYSDGLAGVNVAELLQGFLAPTKSEV